MRNWSGCIRGVRWAGVGLLVAVSGLTAQDDPCDEFCHMLTSPDNDHSVLACIGWGRNIGWTGCWVSNDRCGMSPCEISLLILDEDGLVREKRSGCSLEQQDLEWGDGGRTTSREAVGDERVTRERLRRVVFDEADGAIPAGYLR